jgi:GTP cyclohydrolase III
MDIWKVRMLNNNVKIAQGHGRTPREAMQDLERSLDERRNTRRYQK